MAILREAKIWQRVRAPRTEVLPEDLTELESQNLRTALLFLRDQLGGWVPLAKAMCIKPQTLKQAARRKRRQATAGFAIRAAKVARVRVEIILAGKWPTPLTTKLKGTMGPVKRVGRGPTMR